MNPSGTDIGSLAQIAGSLTLTMALIVGLVWLATGRVVPRARVEQLEKQLDAKDVALQRKDEQIQKLNDQNQALNKGLLDTAVPALARAALILEKYHTDTTVRRDG